MTFYSVDPVRFGVGISGTTTSLGANDPEVGTRCAVGDEEYLFVYNDGNSEIPPTYGAVMSAVTGYSVTVSSTTSVDFLAGVCKNATLATGAYGWLMTKGFTQIEMEADNSCAAGEILALAADGEFALKSNSTGYPTPAVGKAMEAIASGGSGAAYISVN
jgi:hypothetical protein